MQPIWIPSDENIIKTIYADSRLTYDVATVYVVVCRMSFPMKKGQKLKIVFS